MSRKKPKTQYFAFPEEEMQIRLNLVKKAAWRGFFCSLTVALFFVVLSFLESAKEFRFWIWISSPVFVAAMTYVSYSVTKTNYLTSQNPWPINH